ncbi:MAG: 7-cyano-7-deazaguanine synthase QueC [Candidatus Brocadiia bacterium]
MADESETAGRALVLLSGGVDSATTLALARREGFECHALSFRYGQRHAAELEAARRVADALGAAAHYVFDVPLDQIGGSVLTDDSLAVPRDGQAEGGIPPTYVPARNTIFLAVGLAYAEVLGAQALYVGVNAVDYSGYPDCRPEFIEEFRRLARVATRQALEGRPVQIRAPLLHMSKGEIIRTGTELGVDYGLTLSCYDPSPKGLPCGRCDSCRLRRKGFEEAGLRDPAAPV